ncbi:MAG: Holliday junction resolvase Hjc [Candidatus Marsarchaeota archaeon]|jgi:Holliday junction resolvase|nr:Holliday junction resolvase Hjc [Candidatus Marsarchaeota archaeon]MCL5430948.1 Holliday junction resolvase Hjc [Candidatus Marsarchaeota archaeon]
MKRYVKGARSERELLNIMHGKGYSVMRSAGSGVNALSPDIIGFKNARGIALECKAWESTSLSLEREKIEELRRWESNTGMDTFIAWRMNGRGWFFIRLGELADTGKNYTVTMRNAINIGRRLEEVIP